LVADPPEAAAPPLLECGPLEVEPPVECEPPLEVEPPVDEPPVDCEPPVLEAPPAPVEPDVPPVPESSLQRPSMTSSQRLLGMQEQRRAVCSGTCSNRTLQAFTQASKSSAWGAPQTLRRSQ